MDAITCLLIIVVGCAIFELGLGIVALVFKIPCIARWEKHYLAKFPDGKEE